ncbi:MAG: hypothetical protein NZ524_09290 [Thiobacillaceae bacterium]|nr:hypothetical protein [Thiobacillaceae bacterium]MCX7672520.1 hypothetical protein [Thiobacillaceae bacterium]MDW8324717.1 hypothetical protein [Burkholderiales bacterium]
MGKRISGPPRRPRNPVARAVRTPLYRPRVQPNRKRRPPPGRDELEQALAEDEAEKEDEEAGGVT